MIKVGAKETKKAEFRTIRTEFGIAALCEKCGKIMKGSVGSAAVGAVPFSHTGICPNGDEKKNKPAKQEGTDPEQETQGGRDNATNAQSEGGADGQHTKDAIPQRAQCGDETIARS